MTTPDFSREIDFKQIAIAVLVAGLAGEIIFELYAWLVSPAVFGPSLQPSKLVMAIIAKISGLSVPYPLAFVLHFGIGSVGFGVFVFLWRQLMPGRVFLAGLVAGLVLWFVAQGLLAPFIGRPFMMEFGTYTQSSFVGHVGMTLIMSYLMDALISRQKRNHQKQAD